MGRLGCVSSLEPAPVVTLPSSFGAEDPWEDLQVCHVVYEPLHRISTGPQRATVQSDSAPELIVDKSKETDLVGSKTVWKGAVVAGTGGRAAVRN